MSNNSRYVSKAIPGVGWRVWNRKTKRWWGNYFKDYPEAVLVEMNGQKRPEALVKLAKDSFTQKHD